MGFSRQEYWSELPFPAPGDLPDPGIEPASNCPAGDLLHCRWILYYLSHQGSPHTGPGPASYVFSQNFLRICKHIFVGLFFLPCCTPCFFHLGMFLNFMELFFVSTMFFLKPAYYSYSPAQCIGPVTCWEVLRLLTTSAVTNDMTACTMAIRPWALCSQVSVRYIP